MDQNQKLQKMHKLTEHNQLLYIICTKYANKI